MRRAKGPSGSPSGKSNRQPCKDFLKGICTKLPSESWHPPECQFHKSESVCKFGNKCSFPHRKVEEQPHKKPKEGCDKSAVAFFERCATVGLCIPRHRDARIFIDLTEGHKSLGTNSTSTIHKSYAASRRRPRKRRTIAWLSTSQNSSSAQALRYDF